MKRFKLTSGGGRSPEWAGHEFEVEDDATGEQIAEAAAECLIQLVSFGWEPVEEGDDDE